MVKAVKQQQNTQRNPQNKAQTMPQRTCTTDEQKTKEAYDSIQPTPKISILQHQKQPKIKEKTLPNPAKNPKNSHFNKL
jgi:hypothetical protein